MSEDPKLSAREVVLFFEKQRAELVREVREGMNPNEYSKRQIRNADVTFKVGTQIAVKATALRVYGARFTLKRTAEGLREVDPRKIINSVSIHCRLEPLVIARLWPEVEAEILDAERKRERNKINAEEVH